MANIFSDDFSRSDSTSLGPNWTEVSGDWDIVSNRLNLNAESASVLNVCLATATMPSPDYAVQSSLYWQSATNKDHGVAGRATSNTDLYRAEVDRISIKLFKRVGGIDTQLGGSVAISATLSITYTIKLTMQGSAIKAYWEGTEKISQTDASIAGPGKAALTAKLEANPNRVYYDGFTVDEMIWAVDAVAGTLLFSGLAPAVLITVSPISGAVLLAGGIPAVSKSVEPAPISGTLLFSGEMPQVIYLGLTMNVFPIAGQLLMAGQTPALTSFADVTPLTGTVLMANTNCIIPNGDFEAWSSGPSAAPDGWGAGLPPGSSIARDAVNQHSGLYCVALTGGGTRTWLGIVSMPDIAHYKGRTISIGCSVKFTGASNVARIAIWDNVSGYSYSSFHTGGGASEFLTATGTINAAATQWDIYAFVEEIGTAYFDDFIVKEASTVAVTDSSDSILQAVLLTSFAAVNPLEGAALLAGQTPAMAIQSPCWTTVAKKLRCF